MGLKNLRVNALLVIWFVNRFLVSQIQWITFSQSTTHEHHEEQVEILKNLTPKKERKKEWSDYSFWSSSISSFFWHPVVGLAMLNCRTKRRKAKLSNEEYTSDKQKLKHCHLNSWKKIKKIIKKIVRYFIWQKMRKYYSYDKQ